MSTDFISIISTSTLLMILSRILFWNEPLFLEKGEVNRFVEKECKICECGSNSIHPQCPNPSCLGFLWIYNWARINNFTKILLTLVIKNNIFLFKNEINTPLNYKTNSYYNNSFKQTEYSMTKNEKFQQFFWKFHLFANAYYYVCKSSFSFEDQNKDLKHLAYESFRQNIN